MPSEKTSKKRKKESQDFKRVKAKVGKRATKPANETDTSFKTSRVGVTGKQFQEAGNSNSTVLLSSRGRSLDDLVSHLRHPAAAVRISAARGLKDAIAVHHTTSLKNHLAVLVPVCAKCCVDEDGEVRHLALFILKEVISRICSDDTAKKEEEEEDESQPAGEGNMSLHLKPFIPLLMAHVLSTLNSLDRSVQTDGVKLVKLFSSKINTLIAPYRDPILSAYVTILADKSRHLRTSQFTESSTGGKSSTTTTESIKHQVLESIVLLLKEDEGDFKNHQPSDRNDGKKLSQQVQSVLDVKQDGGSITALFIPGCRSFSRTLTPFTLSKQLELSPNPTAHTKGAKSVQTSSDPNTQTIFDLIGNLRDSFAEATQAERGNLDLSIVYLIMKAAHLVYKHGSSMAGRESERDHQSAASKRKQRSDPFVKAWSQYAALLTDLCPVSSATMDHSPKLVADVNLEFCSTMLETYSDGIGACADEGVLDNGVTYLINELKRCRHSESATPKDEALFVPLDQILAMYKSQRNNEWVESAAHRVVNEISRLFFSDDEKRTESAIARSFVARRCTMLVKTFLEQHDWSIVGADSALLSQLVRGLASFLVSWGGDYPGESSQVIVVLHQVVRRLDVSSSGISSEETSLIEHIRTSLIPLVKPEKGRTSTFEAFPTEMQRKTIGLLVMLKSPPQALLDGLAKICARAWRHSENAATASIASLAAQAIHSIRRTISMQAYLGFIVSSTGISGKPLKSAEKTLEATLRFDQGIALGCQFLCQCGPARVLPMLQPLLEEWLSVEQGTTLSVNQALQARAAVSILGSCAARQCEVFSVLEEEARLRQSLVTTTCAILLHLLSMHEDGGSESQRKDSIISSFLAPFALLIQQEPKLFLEVFSEVLNSIQSASITGQTSAVSGLLVLVNEDRMSSVVSESPDLVDAAKHIEMALLSSSAQQLAGRLRAAVELQCGVGTSQAGMETMQPG